MFLPLFADSERAASSGLDFLRSQLSSELYTVAWPLDGTLLLGDQRLLLLGNLDDALGKLPPNSVVVLNAVGSLRHDLALEVIAYINQRREPLRAGGLRLVLCWPAALKDELLSNAPDLWSVRVASPWVEEADLGQTQGSLSWMETPIVNAYGSSSAADATNKLQRWHQYRDLKAADLSPRDALDLANFQYQHMQWASAAELAEAVFFALETKKGTATDGKELIHALNVLSIARSRLGNFPKITLPPMSLIWRGALTTWLTD